MDETLPTPVPVPIPLNVCVGSRASFETWCLDTLGTPAWLAESRWLAIHIANKDDISKLFGIPAPMTLVAFDDDETPEDLKSFVATVVDQENWIASLKNTFNDAT